MLLELCPELLFVPDAGGSVPYHLLQSLGPRYQDVLLTCVRLSLRPRNRTTPSLRLPVERSTLILIDPATHQYSWHHYVAHSSYGVEDILDDCQGMELQLSEQLDANGRRAVDVASAANRQLIMKRIYYFGVFSIKLGCAEHMSATCKLHFACMFDEHGKSRNVAMKFMKNRDQFLSEITFRVDKKLDPQFVVDVICSFDSDADPAYRLEADRRGFAEYPYLVVMDAADRNFQSVLKHERLLESALRTKTCLFEIVTALQHMCEKGLVFADLKRNVHYITFCFLFNVIVNIVCLLL